MPEKRRKQQQEFPFRTEEGGRESRRERKREEENNRGLRGRAGAHRRAAFLRRPDQLEQLSFLINSFRSN